MGVNLRGIVNPKSITLESLKGKRLAVDAFNTLYQFLSIIRGEAGDLLRDNKGNVTSHLSGLFYRNMNLLETGIKLVYVFDGEPPRLKNEEIKRRVEIKVEAQKKYAEAIESEDLELARRYASATAHLDRNMIDDSKKLLDLMGIPWIQAASEGEATAAHLNKKGLADFAASQDYDSLLFGAPSLARNVTISGKRKLPNKPIRVNVIPETVSLEGALSTNGITREQLVEVGMILGTDFNYAGFDGIGPKTAVKLVKKYGKLEDIPDLKDKINFDPSEVRDIFLNAKVADPDPESITQRPPQRGKILSFLCDEHNFSYDRINTALIRLDQAKVKESSTLEQWFS